MSMSDCPKCWDTPCGCGWEFKDYTFISLTRFIVSTLRYRTKEEAIRVLECALETVKEDNKNEENKQI